MNNIYLFKYHIRTDQTNIKKALKVSLTSLLFSNHFVSLKV